VVTEEAKWWRRTCAFPIFKWPPNIVIKFSCLPSSKIIKTLHVASFEHSEQPFTLDELQMPTRIHVINFGTNSNLNLL
jgi:hypothetical protein